MAKDTKTTDDGIVSIQGREYKTVALRTSEFRRAHLLSDGWAILTKIISRDANSVCIQAAIQHDGVTLATGHAEETRQGHINKTSAVENCETSAIGRALAAAGYAGSEFASADELAGKLGPPPSNGQPINRPAATEEVKHQSEGYYNLMISAERRAGLKTQQDIQTEVAVVKKLDLSDAERNACLFWLREQWKAMAVIQEDAAAAAEQQGAK